MPGSCKDVCSELKEACKGSARDSKTCIEKCTMLLNMCKSSDFYLDIVETLKLFVKCRDLEDKLRRVDALRGLDATLDCLAHRCNCISSFLKAVEAYVSGQDQADSAKNFCREFAECVVSTLDVQSRECSSYTRVRVTGFMANGGKKWILLSHSLTSNTYHDISDSTCPMGTWIKGIMRTSLYALYAIAVLHNTRISSYTQTRSRNIRVRAFSALTAVLRSTSDIVKEAGLVNIPRYLLGGGGLASPLLVRPENRFRRMDGCLYTLGVDETSIASSFYTLSLIYANAQRQRTRWSRSLADAARYAAYAVKSVDVALPLLLEYLAGDVCKGYSIVDVGSVNVSVINLRGQCDQCCINDAIQALSNICLSIVAYAQYITSSVSRD